MLLALRRNTEHTARFAFGGVREHSDWAEGRVCGPGEWEVEKGWGIVLSAQYCSQ